MNQEILKTEILVLGQNVQCGAKLAAEIHYMYNEPLYDETYVPEDILLIEETLKYFPDLKYMISYHPDKQARKDGHKSVYIYKHEYVKRVIDSIESVKELDGVLYHFASGKLFGYGDYEVMEFIKKDCCKGTTDSNFPKYMEVS